MLNMHLNMLYMYKGMIYIIYQHASYSKTCVRQPPLKLTLVVDVERWLSYKGACHVILLAKLHDMYLYKTDIFFCINHFFKASLEDDSLTQVLLYVLYMHLDIQICYIVSQVSDICIIIFCISTQVYYKYTEICYISTQIFDLITTHTLIPTQ